MNERQMQFRVGIVVFATMIVGGLLASLNGPLPTGWLPWGRAKYQIGIQVPEAPGVDTNTPVRKNGILIGRVKSIEDSGDGVLLKADIDGNRPLFADFEPHIRTSVLGDATIDFVSHRPAPGAQPVPDGTIFRGHVDPNPFESLGQLGDLKEEFGKASQSLAAAGDEVTKLTKRINAALGDETGETHGRITRLLDSTERAMNQFSATMTSFNEIIGDVPLAGQQPGVGQPAPGAQPPRAPPPVDGRQLRQHLRQGLDELPDAIHEFHVTMQESHGVLQSADKNLKNLEGFTEPLREKGGDFADMLLKVVNGLDQLVDDFGSVARALNSRDGSIGKLIHDPQVYDNLNILMFNANKVLCSIDDLTFNLKPVVHDARIFMDKVATEPGRIIGGAVNPSNRK
jgi:phospholipid/cholesterol/gamma-HCH transport system substrate-binding protein